MSLTWLFLVLHCLLREGELTMLLMLRTSSNRSNVAARTYLILKHYAVQKNSLEHYRGTQCNTAEGVMTLILISSELNSIIKSQMHTLAYKLGIIMNLLQSPRCLERLLARKRHGRQLSVENILSRIKPASLRDCSAADWYPSSSSR